MVCQKRLFLPKDHWIQSKNHGGRIIGEACHIFELLQFLTDAKPKKIKSAEKESPEEIIEEIVEESELEAEEIIEETEDVPKKKGFFSKFKKKREKRK